MKALIIEDEQIAAQALKALLAEAAPDVEVIDTLQTIDDSVEWLLSHPMPDLVFMDIHLADGSSFSIFEEVDITAPIIFTTAYDEYALKAFEVNSIDYLLKPISADALKRAINKFRNFSHQEESNQQLRSLLNDLQATGKGYKSNFLVFEKDSFYPLPVGEIAYIYIDAKLVKAVTLTGKKHYFEQTLDEIMHQLDPVLFYRANRQYIISKKAIKDVSIWFHNKLSVNLVVNTPERILVSKAKVSDFKKWLVR